MTSPFLLQSLAQVFTEHMLNSMLQSGVLAALAWVLLKVIGRRSSSTRFAVWFVVLVAVVVLPWMESISRGQPFVSAADSGPVILVPGSWALYLFCMWVVIAIGALARVALGLWQIRWMREKCSEMDVACLDPLLQQVVADMSRRPVGLYVSQSLRVPMATGFFKPMIVIPAWAMRELSTDELRVVLLHEAAHLRRWDDWTNLAQKVLRAVFFFHPLVWWIEGRLALEREMACDDLVVAQTSSPRAYAQCLVALAERSLGRRNLAFAQAAVNRMRHTSLRIQQILDIERSGATRVWRPAVALVMASAMACFVFVDHTPRLVGFRPQIDDSKAGTSVATQTSAPALGFDSLVRKVALPTARVRPGVTVVRTRHAANELLPQIAPQIVAPQTLDAQRTDIASVEPVQPVMFVPANSSVGAAETVFVVLQDQQFNAAGDRLWSIRVYRLTVYYPGAYSGNPQKILNKSI